MTLLALAFNLCKLIWAEGILDSYVVVVVVF